MRDVIISFFASITVDAKIQFELMSIDSQHDCIAFRTKYIDQFDYLKTIFMSTTRTDEEINEFNLLRVFYVMKTDDFNVLLMNENIEVFPDSYSFIPRNYFVVDCHCECERMLNSERNIVAVVGMSKDIFKVLKSHIDKCNSDQTEVFSICEHALCKYEGHHNTIYPQKYVDNVKTVHAISDFFMYRFSKFMVEDFFSEWMKFAINDINERVPNKRRFGSLSELPLDIPISDENLHPELSFSEQKEMKEIFSLMNVETIVFNKEKTFNRKKFNFSSDCYRMKCVGGSSKLKVGMVTEMPIETFLREMSEEWNLNLKQLTNLYDRGKIKLFDRFGRILRFDDYVPYRNGARTIRLAPMKLKKIIKDLKQTEKIGKTEKDILISVLSEVNINEFHFSDIWYAYTIVGDEIFKYTYGRYVDYDNCIPISKDNGLFACHFDVTIDELELLLN
jgi:hypothetical protein